MHYKQHIKHNPTQRRDGDEEKTGEHRERKSLRQKKKRVDKKVKVSVCPCLLNSAIGRISQGSILKAT